MAFAQLSDYTALVTSQHQGKPNFAAVLAAVLQPLVDEVNVLGALQTSFDLDAAIGDQLDAVGAWVGLSRTLSLPISGVYFAFDSVGVGFDQGIWFGPGSPAEGAVSLDDDTYRTMLRAKIAANTWDGSLGDANAKLATALGAGVVLVVDNFDMTESVILSGSAASQIFSQLVQKGYIQLRPAAVSLTVFQAPSSFGVDVAAEVVTHEYAEDIMNDLPFNGAF